MPHCRLARVSPRPGPSLRHQRRNRSLAVVRAAPIRRHVLAAARRLALRARRPTGKLISEAAGGAAVLHGKHRLPPRPPPQRGHPELQPPRRPRRNNASTPGARVNAAGWTAGYAIEALGRASRGAGHLPRRPSVDERDRRPGFALAQYATPPCRRSSTSVPRCALLGFSL